MAAGRPRDQKIADHMGLVLLLLGVCGAVAGLLAGFGIARGVQRSMVQLAVPIGDATGKLEEVVGPITVFSDPSFRGLERALQQLSDKSGPSSNGCMRAIVRPPEPNNWLPWGNSRPACPVSCAIP